MSDAENKKKSAPAPAPNQARQDPDKTVATDFMYRAAEAAAQSAVMNSGGSGLGVDGVAHGDDTETIVTLGAHAGAARTHDTLIMDDTEHRQSARVGTPQIPGYEIVRILGEGGMGVVYEARQVAVHRTVALKVLKPAVAAEPEFRERFLRESAAAGSVAHPNVVQIFDAGEADGHLFMTFQMIEGGDLSELLKVKGQLSEYKSLQIIKECLQGLQAINQAGLVHRDIKPGNIFMEGGRRPVIGDLGLARQTSGDDRMTMTGAAMGTPSYMSPEHIRGIAEIDIRTDLYALGSTLYKMLTGTEPFHGETVYAITHSIISQPIPDPREINASLSIPVVGIIRKAMAKDREERYQNPEQFLQDIEAALAGHQLIHAEGLGLITGVKKAEPAEAAQALKSTPSLGRGRRVSPSFLRTWGKPIAALFLVAWLMLVFKWSKLDNSRYEPDWAAAAAKDQYGRYVVLKVGRQMQEFRLIRGGERFGHILVGAKASEPGYRPDEKFSAAVINHDFWLADTEVTQALWLELMETNPSTYKNSYYPVQNVSYENVQEFLKRLNKAFAKGSYKTPFVARLPTQEEWEHACRAGTELMPYGDQDQIKGIGFAAVPALKTAWEELWKNDALSDYETESAAWTFVEKTPENYGPQVVKLLQPNRWGVYDMIGNVAEICADSWDGLSTHADPVTGDFKVVHGGSWFDHPYRCRAGARLALGANESASSIGFRIVIEMKPLAQ